MLLRSSDSDSDKEAQEDTLNPSNGTEAPCVEKPYIPFPPFLVWKGFGCELLRPIVAVLVVLPTSPLLFFRFLLFFIVYIKYFLLRVRDGKGRSEGFPTGDWLQCFPSVENLSGSLDL